MDAKLIKYACRAFDNGCCYFSQVKRSVMPKTNDLFDEVLRNPKHPFRHVTDRPNKTQKNRYERRKIKEILKSGDWSSYK
jgi:hypothetical protein